jgi:hypothetical protein
MSTRKQGDAVVSINAESIQQQESLKLSDSVMSMKFMKSRQSIGINKESIVKSDSISTVSIDLDDLELPGRRSFGGFNKYVEKYYQMKLDELKLNSIMSNSSVKGGGVSDEEMLERYENLVGLPRGPKQSKKQKPEEILPSNKYKRKLDTTNG